MKFPGLLTGLTVGMLFAVSLIIFPGFVDLTVTGKQLFLFFYFAIVSIIFCLYCVFNPLALSLNRTDVFVIFFFIYISIRTVFTPAVSLKSYEFIVFLLMFWVYGMGRFIAGHYKNQVIGYSSSFQAMSTVIITIALVQALFGLLQYSAIAGSFNENFRITGFFGNPGHYAIFLAGLLPFVAGFFVMSNPNRFLRIYAIVTVCFVTVAIILSGSRSAWIAVTAGMVYLLVHRFSLVQLLRKKFDKTWKIILFLLVVISFGLASAYGLFHYKEGSAIGRLFIWKNSIEMIKSHPLSGYGFDQFQAKHNEFQAGFFKNNHKEGKYAMLAANDPYAFNDYLQIAVEFGIIGLFLFLGIFVSLFKIKPANDTGKKPYYDNGLLNISRASVLVVLVTALFAYPLLIVPSAVVLFFFTGLASGYQNNKNINIFLPSGLLKISAIAGLVFSGFFFKYSAGQFVANKQWKKAYILSRSDNQHRVLGIYERIFPIMKQNKYFQYNYATMLLSTGDYQKGLELLEKSRQTINDIDVYLHLGSTYEVLEDYQKAIESFETAHYLIPHRFYPRYRLIPLYFVTGEQDKALNLAYSTLEMEEKVPSATVNMIKRQIREFVDVHGQ